MIDDEEPVRTAVTDILEMKGLHVLAASNGREGLAIYRRQQANILLVLLDLSMPGMSGEETFRELPRSIRSCASSCHRAMTRLKSRHALPQTRRRAFCRSRTAWRP